MCEKKTLHFFLLFTRICRKSMKKKSLPFFPSMCIDVIKLRIMVSLAMQLLDENFFDNNRQKNLIISSQARKEDKSLCRIIHWIKDILKQLF